ncbi:MAG: phosphonate ABC transporter, permease protein PhnE [Rhodospirillaceae bacterium]|nr:MAG: phosphonate ABC transporter, permease protein PhnE [Rhodospirillaceae bacterium]
MTPLDTVQDRYPEVWKKHSPRQSLIRFAWYFGVVFLAVWSVRHLDIPWLYFLDAHVQAYDLAERMFPPDWSYIDVVLDPLIETVHIATLGTIVTFFIAFPTAFIAARNTTPNTPLWLFGKFLLVSTRSVNTVVWALIFVAIFGPGPVAGIWAVAFRSVGFVGKLIAESIEEIDEGQVEAIEASGASRLQVLMYGVLPQVLPVVFGTIVYRWDINIRESTVLGFVGAGGIGIELYASINQFAWNEVSLMLLTILGVVLISEFVSAAVRGKIT